MTWRERLTEKDISNFNIRVEIYKIDEKEVMNGFKEINLRSILEAEKNSKYILKILQFIILNLNQFLLFKIELDNPMNIHFFLNDIQTNRYLTINFKLVDQLTRNPETISNDLIKFENDKDESLTFNTVSVKEKAFFTFCDDAGKYSKIKEFHLILNIFIFKKIRILS